MGIVTTQWHPLLQLPGGGWAGFAGERQDNVWVGSYDEARREVDLARPVALLPLLEQPRSVVQAEIAELSDQGQVTFASTLLKCFEAVIDTAILMESHYWVDRAIDWIEAGGPLPCPDIRLNTISNATWVSQPLRHKALRLAGRWKKVSRSALEDRALNRREIT